MANLYSLSVRLEPGSNLLVLSKTVKTVRVTKEFVGAGAGGGPGGPGGAGQCCQMEKFDPFLSLDCATAEDVGAQSKERKETNFAA